MSANSAESADTALPDGQWTPEQQIAHMLDLCEAQMEAALSESDQAMDSLIKAFAYISENAGGAVPNNTVEHPSQEDLSKHLASAIVAFQFYDKLTQRLGHVRYSLSTLAMFVCDRTQSAQRDKWKKLFSALKRLYKTEEERAIFQLVTEGLTAEEARERVQANSNAAAKAPDIELF